MFSEIWHTFFFDPVYNTLIFFIETLPSKDVGLAVIGTVIAVKLILLPLSFKATKTQLLMRHIQPELDAIKEKYKDSREELARKTLEVYRKVNINPFATIGIIFIQLPLVIAIYLSVRSLPIINQEVLYSFVSSSLPFEPNMFFLGFIAMNGRNVALAALAGFTAYLQAKYLVTNTKKTEKKEKSETPSIKDDFAESMRFSMLYMMPVMIFFASYSISAVIALYFIISNITTIAQEWYLKRTIKI